MPEETCQINTSISSAHKFDYSDLFFFSSIFSFAFDVPYFGLPCPATYFLANAAWTRARKFRCYVPLPLPFHSCTLPFSFTQHYLSHSAPTRHLITKINFQMPCHKDFQPIFRLDFLVQHHKSFVYTIILSMSLCIVKRGKK